MTTQTDVAELYTAFFNRAPDSAGLAYWVNELQSGVISLQQMASNWVNEQPEGQTNYPSGTSDAAFIAAIYSNVLGRLADTAGAQYWQNQLASGAVTRDVFIAAIINGAHANTSAQGVLDAQLLSNKAAAGVAFANQGVNDTTLAAKVLTTVNSSSDSLSSTLSLIKLIPAGTLTPAMVSSLNDTITKVAALIVAEPNEAGDMATYLSTLSAGVTSTTDLNVLLGKIGALAVAALTDSTALDNPATLAQNDLGAANPPAGGGGDGGGGDPGNPTPTLTATNDNGVLKIVGTSTADVHIDMNTHVVTSGATTLTVVGTADFTSVDSGTYGGSVTAVGTAKQILNLDSTYTGVDHLQIVDKALNILGWALELPRQPVESVSVLNNAAGTLSLDQHSELNGLTTTHDWTYDIRDTVQNITFAENAGDPVLGSATEVVVGDTLVNLASDDGIAVRGIHEYSVIDTYANISGASPDEQTLINGAEDVIVRDTVAGVQQAISDGFTAEHDYQVVDTAQHLLDINASDANFLHNATAVSVAGDDAGQLTLQQRDDLGKVTDNEHWHYAITDTAEHIVAGITEHLDFLQRADDVTIDGSISLGQLGVVANTQGLDSSGWHYSIVDSVENANAYPPLGDLNMTLTASAGVDELDGNVSTGAITMSFSGLTDASTFTFANNGFSSNTAADAFLSFQAATDKIDLQAFHLTGEDTLSLVAGGNNAITDGHFALVKGVALENGVYVASSAPDAGTLVIWDADTTAGVIKQVGVFVADASLDVSAVVTGPVTT
ncbi:DUF4214 domain-containing protein [Pseudomonas sp. NPDC090202]|uniref:DUF4214 domain-containing protein n=1 Tax=unclassified Pseudomonas TaxID=196821 RepID=UPI0037F6E66A